MCQKSLSINHLFIISLYHGLEKPDLLFLSTVFPIVMAHPNSTPPAQQVPATVYSLPLSSVLTPLQTKLIFPVSPAAVGKSSVTPHLSPLRNTFFDCFKENDERQILRYDTKVSMLVIFYLSVHLDGVLVLCL